MVYIYVFSFSSLSKTYFSRHQLGQQDGAGLQYNFSHMKRHKQIFSLSKHFCNTVSISLPISFPPVESIEAGRPVLNFCSLWVTILICKYTSRFPCFQVSLESYFLDSNVIVFVLLRVTQIVILHS